MNQPEPVCLLIADISGYTEYLSTVEIDHAQDILADLIGTVVTSLRPAFRLAKLEGDAAFCFAPAAKVDATKLLDTIERCYFSFRRRRRDVRQATSCECRACVRIPDLNLKFVAHYGQALRQKMYGRDELFGGDVILVHRLLKNDVVERLGLAAYGLLTERLASEMAIEPEDLAMIRHQESYEHIGELLLWVHDLERRWQDEEERRRVFVTADDALFSMEFPIDAPPQLVWEFVTTPGRRTTWQGPSGVTGIDERTSGGRRGMGTVNHCLHGKEAAIEEILDWRPFDYYTDRSALLGGGPTFVTTTEFEPTPAGGTIVHLRIAPPGSAAERAMMEAMGPEFAAGMTASAELLRVELNREVGALVADRAEPPLPERKATDGFLAGVPAIQLVD